MRKQAEPWSMRQTKKTEKAEDKELNLNRMSADIQPNKHKEKFVL